MIPTLESQIQLVQEAEDELRATVKRECAGDPNKPFRAMVVQLLPTLRTCPASTRVEYHGAYTGGLLVHTNQVIQTALRVVDSIGGIRVFDPMVNDVHVDRASVVRCCFLHDLGKIGDITERYYLEQDNEWRRDNLGETYQINRTLYQRYLPVPVRSLWLAQHFGVELTQEEYQAIVASDGPQTAMGATISTVRETPLTMLVHFADKWTALARGI